MVGQTREQRRASVDVLIARVTETRAAVTRARSEKGRQLRRAQVRSLLSHACWIGQSCRHPRQAWLLKELDAAERAAEVAS